MKLTQKEFKDLLKSNLAERIYKRCRTCDRIKVVSELAYIVEHQSAQLPAKGLSRHEIIAAIKKGIAAHDAFLENVAKERSCAKLMQTQNLNQISAF